MPHYLSGYAYFMHWMHRNFFLQILQSRNDKCSENLNSGPLHVLMNAILEVPVGCGEGDGRYFKRHQYYRWQDSWRLYWEPLWGNSKEKNNDRSHQDWFCKRNPCSHPSRLQRCAECCGWWCEQRHRARSRVRFCGTHVPPVNRWQSRSDHHTSTPAQHITLTFCTSSLFITCCTL